MGLSHQWHRVTPEEVLKHLEAAPPELRSDVSLATALANSGKPTEALEKLHEVIAREPHNVRAFISLGAILSEIGHKEEALESMRQAVRLAPDDFSAHWGLGFMLHKYGQLEEAKVELAKVVALADHSPEAETRDDLQRRNEQSFASLAQQLLDTL